MTNWVLQNINLFSATQATGCRKDFFGFPTWFKYLDTIDTKTTCVIKFNDINDIWLIVLAIVEILLRVAIFAAIAYVMIGGFKYITSRANPDKTASAKNTVVDGVIGLVIAIVATAVVSFVARRFSG